MDRKYLEMEDCIVIIKTERETESLNSKLFRKMRKNSQTIQKNNLNSTQIASDFDKSKSLHLKTELPFENTEMETQIKVEEDLNSIIPNNNGRINTVTEIILPDQQETSNLFEYSKKISNKNIFQKRESTKRRRKCEKNSDRNVIQNPCEVFSTFNIKQEPEDSLTNCRKENFYAVDYHKVIIKTEKEISNSTPMKEEKTTEIFQIDDLDTPVKIENECETIWLKELIEDNKDSLLPIIGARNYIFKEKVILDQSERSKLSNFKECNTDPLNQKKNEESPMLNDDSPTYFDYKPYLCKFCPKRYKTEICRKQHELLHNPNKPFSCDECEKCFITRLQLKKHLSIHTNNCLFQCILCEKKFIGKEYLKLHLKTHSTKTELTCNICHRTLCGKTSLETHLMWHLGEEKFKCDYCDKGFLRKSNLTLHLKTHLEKKEFTCEFCHRKFMGKDYLNVHILKVHVHKNKFSCPLCHKHLSSERSLHYHVQNHNAEKPYKCEMCGLRMRFSSALLKHVKIHGEYFENTP